MDEAEVYTRLTSVFHDVFTDDCIAIHPQFSPNELAAWDSLMHLRLLLTIEKTFKIRFSASEIGDLKNVGELVSVITSRSGHSVSESSAVATHAHGREALFAG